MHVLCVDDEQMNRRIVRELLTAAEVTMDEAHDAEAGLALLDAQPFDLILMDLRMPGMDGLSAIRTIREQQGAGPSTPVILVTADTSEDLDARSLAAGANEVVRKPIDMRILFDAIARVMYSGESATLS